MSYDIALICSNGHVVNSYSAKYPEDNANYCSKCGAKTIDKCTECSKPIKGHAVGEFGYMSKYERPAFCQYCGCPFPWTKKAIKNTKLIIQEEKAFSEEQIENLISSLPDVITETPGTNLASIRIKKALTVAGKFTAEGIRQFVIDFGCELAKKSIGL